MALLAGIGILDWPVAVVLAAGHLLSRSYGSLDDGFPA